MLFLGEWAGVQADLISKQSKSPIWQHTLEEFTKGIFVKSQSCLGISNAKHVLIELTGEQLRDVCSDNDRRLTNIKELVDKSPYSDENQANKPCSKGGLYNQRQSVC